MKLRLIVLCCCVCLSISAQETTESLIARVIATQPRLIPKYDARERAHVYLLRTGFNDAIYSNKTGLQGLKGKVITKVELVYTTYRKSETFDQHGLNRKRLRALIAAAPQLLTQPGIEWVLIGQTGCTSSEQGKDYYHGVTITYREPASEALSETELSFLKEVAAGSVPSYAYDAYLEDKMPKDSAGGAAGVPAIKMPEFPGGERNRIDFFTANLKYPSQGETEEPEQVAAQFVIDQEGNIKNISLPNGQNSPFDNEVIRFLKSLPDWKPATIDGKKIDCMVMLTVDFMDRGRVIASPLEIYAMNAPDIPKAPKFDYAGIKPTPQSKMVSSTLQKNDWKNTVLVCDVTASMAPYSAQVLEYIKTEFKMRDTTLTRFVFFNDGDGRKDNTKKAGNVGGIYTTHATTLDEVLKVMGEAMRKGDGGDLEENNIEALVQAETFCPTCTSTTLIADNLASPRDLALVAQLTKPVHVIVCGNGPVLNEDYMNLVRMTKGSLHFQGRDYTNLHTFEEGATVQVGKETFVVKKGKYVRKD